MLALCVSLAALLLLPQVKKDEKELTVGWGVGPTFDLPKRGPQLDADGKQVGRGAGLICDWNLGAAV